MRREWATSTCRVPGAAKAAVTGELSIMLDGAASDIERSRPHLEPLGTTVPVVGRPAGARHAAKALNNLLAATNFAAAGKSSQRRKTFGIEVNVMVDVLNASTDDPGDRGQVPPPCADR